MPRVATLAAAGAWDGQVYLVGGADGLSHVTDRVDVYDIATDTWSVGDSAPGPVSIAGFVQSGSELYLTGGLVGGEERASDDVLRLDLGTESWTSGPSLTSARYGTSLVATSEALYVMGGIGSDYTDRAERLDLASWSTGEWTELEPLPSTVAFAPGACGLAGDDAVVSVLDGVNSSAPHMQLTVPGEACA